MSQPNKPSINPNGNGVNNMDTKSVPIVTQNEIGAKLLNRLFWEEIVKNSFIQAYRKAKNDTTR